MNYAGREAYANECRDRNCKIINEENKAKE